MSILKWFCWVILISCSPKTEQPSNTTINNKDEMAEEPEPESCVSKNLMPFLPAQMCIPGKYDIKLLEQKTGCEGHGLVHFDLLIGKISIHVEELMKCKDNEMVEAYSNALSIEEGYTASKITDRMIVKEKGDLWKIYVFRNPYNRYYCFTAEGSGEQELLNCLNCFETLRFSDSPKEYAFQ